MRDTMQQFDILDCPADVPGVRLATAAAGVRKVGRVDLCLLEIAPGARAAALFTRNRFCAAPVHVARAHLALAAPRLLVINSGNANAGTGIQGHADALAVCAAGAVQLGCEIEAVLPFSTGVIGQRLPAERIVETLPGALDTLHGDGWLAAAQAIMTTDTVPKWASARVNGARGSHVVTGIAKGAGMIKPDLATMLAFIATDAPVTRPALATLLREVCDRSFNRITIDGDTSTNDSCVLVATGVPADVAFVPGHQDWPAFAAAVEAVCVSLARAIVRDGEGATRLVTVRVDGADSTADALKAAYAVAESPLVKTALFAGDPNWGRILAAVGRSGVADLDITQVSIALDDYAIVRDGEPVQEYEEKVAADIMARPEFEIRVTLGRGTAAVEVITCDFSYDYVKINAEYRS
jgi:glutamate N-acetyltransferase/amino-acid N-acetyltransferase